MKKLLSEIFVQNKMKYLSLFLVSMVVVIFSFPEVDLVYTIGIDPALTWLFNHLFETGLAAGNEIIFPHGPLAFLMYPLANNFLLATLVTIVLQVVFVFQLFSLLNGNKKYHWVLTAVLAWLIFSLSNFNQLVIANVAIAYLLFLRNGKPAFKYWGILLTAFAFYVKAWVAIITGTFTFSLLVIQMVNNRNYRKLVADVAIWGALMYLLWLVMFGRFSGFVAYGIGMLHLAGDNSAAAAFHPNNNWLLLLPLVFVTLVLPLVRRNRSGILFIGLFFLSFFAAWKYGMAWEDYFHVRTYFFFLLISMVLFVVYKQKDYLLNGAVVLVAAVLFVLNMKNVDHSQPFSFHYAGISNFIDFVGSYTDIKAASEEQNRENIASNELPASVRQQIGQATVDVYPWDYTIVAANKLNWRPRPVIQSYAAYTSWLDEQNAYHFAGDQAPEYFIFDLNKITLDLNGEKLESIDNRYLLNDEPQTLLEILKHYQRIYSDKDFLVSKRKNQPLEIHSLETKLQTAQWHEWITVPDTATVFTRLKLNIKPSFSGALKSKFYKDELYYAYYKTKDGRVLKYRIVPKNAADGIWVTPFYTSAGDNVPAASITGVMLVCSDRGMVCPLTYQWEYWDATEFQLNDFFGKDSIQKGMVEWTEALDFDSQNERWQTYHPDKVVNYSYYKQKAYRLEPGLFSPTFVFNTDSLSHLPMRLDVGCWLKTYKGAIANLVIETEDADGKKYWKGIDINWQIINPLEQNYIFNYLDLEKPGTKVSVYVWNNGKKSVMIYDLNLTVRSE